MKFSTKSVILVINLTVLCLVSGFSVQNVKLPDNDLLLYSESLRTILNNLETRNFLGILPKIKLKFGTCEKDLLLLMGAAKRMEPWALNMVDASTKIPSGLMAGNVADLGMFDECVAVRGNFSTAKNSGRHCIYQLNFIMPGNVTLFLKPKLGMCVPSTCDVENIVYIIDLLNEYLHKKGILNETINVKTEYATCSYLNIKEWPTGRVIFSCVLFTFVLFLLVCTTLELAENWLRAKNYNSGIITSLSRFSLINSSLRLLSLKAPSGSISTIHGIRALSILWIVYGHELYFSLVSNFINTIDFLHWTKSWKSLYLSMGIYAVDTFLLLSGFLLSYLFLKRMSHGRKFNIFEFYLHRYIRLTPALAVLVLITIYVAPHLGSGPRWEGDIVANVSSRCEDSWWKIILYVQNYAGKIPAENLLCLGHLWYLSVDMQLFWLSPLIIYPLSKKPKIGLIILGLAFIASIVTPAVIVAKYELLFSTLSIDHLEKMVDTANKYYVTTHCRASPWLAGIFFGFIMVTKKSPPKKNVVILGWTTALICFIFCTLGHILTSREEYEYNVVLETAVACLGHFIWAIGVSWIIYICHHGMGGPINKFLSLPIFLPISRVSYSLYLLHYLYQNLKSGSTRVSNYFSDFGIFQSYLGDLFFCLILSFFFCIIFESPIMVLEKMTFSRENKENKDKEKENAVQEISEQKVDEFRVSVEKHENGQTVIDPATKEPTTTL